MHSFLQLIDTFDTDNYTRGVQFEKLCKWLLENHPLYKSKLKQVWLWDDWPERWGKGCGIDLVATKSINRPVDAAAGDSFNADCLSARFKRLSVKTSAERGNELASVVEMHNGSIIPRQSYRRRSNYRKLPEVGILLVKDV